MTVTNEDSLNSLFPYQDPEGWNLRIGDFLFVSNPGDSSAVTVEIDGFEPESKFDEKESQGTNGTGLTYQGYRLPRGTFRISCWTNEGWQFLQLVLSALRPPKGNTPPTAWDVFHPALAAVGITRIFIEKVSPPKWAGQKLTVTISAIEFAPPPKTAKSVTKPLKIGDVPDAYSASKTSDGVPFGPPPPPSKTPPTPT